MLPYNTDPSFFLFCPQVRCEQPGAAGGRRLHDRLPERSNASQEDAWHQLAEEMLPDDRQEVGLAHYDGSQ